MILEELKYSGDSSVCSQRIDFISSNFINPKWIFAPRLPYHPRENNAFRQGNRKILVVPVSALIMPFISSTLYALGLNFMKMMFRILYMESIKTGKPIVYLMHPAEFADESKKIKYKKSFKDIKARGLYFRRRIKLHNSANDRFNSTKNFFEYVNEYPDVEYMTVYRYVKSFVNEGYN